MRRTVTVAVAVMMLLAACGGSEDSAEGGIAEPQSAAAPADAAIDAEAAGAEPGARAGDGAAADDVAGPLGPGDPAVLPASVLGDRIVRDGTMRLEVDEGTFDDAFERLVQLADRYGGTVLASDLTTADDASTSGTVTIRVPTDDFDALLVAVGRVGRVEHRSITSEDVSGEFVDLEARLRHNRAQERFYLSLLDRAEGVDDAIAVQQRVEGIQQTIEQIQGRLRFLEDRTSFSRLTVEVFEAGGAFQAGGQQPEPSLARYWATARAALVNVVGGALVVATVLLPFVVVGTLVLVLSRRFALPRRETGAPDA